MLIAIILIVVAVVIYATRKIDNFVDGMHEPSACNHNCRQGRDCTCVSEEKA
jgi:inner membrane protein involved in colicin E2 resistance